MTPAIRVSLAVGIAMSTLAVLPVAQEGPVKTEKTLFVNSQESYSPGFPIGDIAIAEPAVADFRVIGGRRELLLMGKAPGTTTLIIWDQRKVKREEMEITVTTREDVQAEKDLKELIAEFPEVQVRRVRGQLALVGTVRSQQDLNAVERLASAGGANNLVRLASRYGSPSGEAPATPSGTPAGTPSGDPSRPTARGGVARPSVEYEVLLLEANEGFSSGSYGTGVEPSGRTLYRQQVTAPLDGEAEVYVPGNAVESKSGDKSDKKGQASPVGLRMKLQPRDLQEDGSFTTFVAIETNVPVPGHTDPGIMRRARWELSSGPSEPFGLAGAELFAVPRIEQSGSKIGKAMSIAGTVGGLPGVNRAPGVGYVGSVPYYDRAKKTQVLALIRPKVVEGRP